MPGIGLGVAPAPIDDKEHGNEEILLQEEAREELARTYASLPKRFPSPNHCGRNISHK